MKPGAVLLILIAITSVGVAQDKIPKVETRATLATVRLVNPVTGARGSGVVIHRTATHAYILTAQHLVHRAATVEVEMFSARTYPQPATTYAAVAVLAEARVPDLAILRVKFDGPPPVALPLCQPGSVPEGKGFTGLAVGCAIGGAPTAEEVKISGKKRIQRPGETAPLWAWECTEPATKGRSGGPLVDSQGRVIGIASGNSSGHGYFTHVQEIHQFLDRHELAFLYREK